jgi:hypothetical protein
MNIDIDLAIDRYSTCVFAYTYVCEFLCVYTHMCTLVTKKALIRATFDVFLLYSNDL